MKNKKNADHFSSFRCDFNAENLNDKIMTEKLLHLRQITQFNNKQLLNFLLCLGDETISDCQTFSDFLGMFSISKKAYVPNASSPPGTHPPFPAAQPSDTQMAEYHASSTQTQAPAEPPGPSRPVTEQESSPLSRSDTTLDDLFQSDDDPETEKMIADMLNL